MTKKPDKPLPLLRPVDFGLVVTRLQGILINVDRDLQRRKEQAVAKLHVQSRARDAERTLSLLNVMVRFAHNSYNAMLYLCADTPEDPNRKPNYVLVVPNVNRQLLDLLFTLVYILDDLSSRSLAYQWAGWRELLEEYRQQHTRFAKDPEWADHFKRVRGVLKTTAQTLDIPAEKQKKPESIDYWPTPTQMNEKPTKSRAYLRYLTKWLYGDTSAQTHFSFGGVVKVAPMILAPLIGGEAEKMVNDRIIHQYRYQQLNRVAIVTLAIATEINNYCVLRNDEQISYVWGIFKDHSAEAKEMWDIRYKRSGRGIAWISS